MYIYVGSVARFRFRCSQLPLDPPPWEPIPPLARLFLFARMMEQMGQRRIRPRRPEAGIIEIGSSYFGLVRPLENPERPTRRSTEQSPTWRG